MNQTPRYDLVEITVLNTDAVGENVTFANRRFTWRRTNATFNDSNETWTTLKRNACLAMKWELVLSKKPKSGEPDTRAYMERDPPLQVYCDYEAVTDAEGNQTPILICAETDEEDETVAFYGLDCTIEFVEWLGDKGMDQDGDDRDVIAIFHNLEGYDGMFFLQYCYAAHCTVKQQITQDTKILPFKSDRLTFKDSLCFLPFPLANFPTTFGIEELCKGFFPHNFNTLENQGYEGPIPDTTYYDSDGMSAKKKAEFERWHAKKVPVNYHLVMRQEMETYCE